MFNCSVSTESFTFKNQLGLSLGSQIVLYTFWAAADLYNRIDTPDSFVKYLFLSVSAPFSRGYERDSEPL